MSSQFDLFGPRPRAKPRVLMHVVDAGEFPDGTGCVHLVCPRCGHDTGWELSRGLTRDKRGWPCPTCNGQT